LTLPASGPRALAVCLLSGIALSLAFPEPSLAPLAWIAVAPLIVIGAGASPRRGFTLAFVFGLGFFSLLLLWVSAVGWIAWLLLVVMEAAMFGLFGLGWSLIARLGRVWWMFAGPALWVTVELVREYFPIVGFPWGQLAQGQVATLWMLPTAGIGGAKVVSFIVVAINVCVALAWLGEKDRSAVASTGGRRATGSSFARRIGFVGVAGILLALGPFVGLLRPHTDTSTEPLKVAIVQGNAGPGVQVEDESARVDRHRALTEELSAEGLDLVVWPESSVGIDPTLDADIAAKVADAALAADAPMIVGANLEAGDDRYMVMTLHVDRAGEIVDRYQKTHLVPFGEYIPARSLIGGLSLLQQVPRDAVAGNEPRNFDVEGTEVATVISFEGDFGPLVRDRIDAGARLLVVATNTSTWGRSWASAQHVAMSQVRAAENGVPVAHAALSGISAVITSEGRVLADTPLYEEATLVHELAPSDFVTFYARTGEWFPLLCLAITIVAASAGARSRRVDTVG